MRVHRQVFGRLRSRVLEVVAGHPVVLAAAGHVLHLLAVVAAHDFRPALPARPDQPDGEPLVVGHRHDGRLAEPGQPLNAHLFGIDRLVRFQVVEGAAGPPRPSPQRAPVVRLARLPLVAQPDDARGQPLIPAVAAEPAFAPAGVRLDAVRRVNRVPPALLDELLGPRFGCAGARGRRNRRARPAREGEPVLHHHRDRAGGVGRGREGELNFHLDVRVRRVIDRADRLLRRHADVAHLFLRRLLHHPRHFGHGLRHPPVHVAVEVFQNLRPPLLPPGGRLHRLAVVEHQRVGQRLVRGRLGLVFVGGVRGVRVVTVRAAAEVRNLEQVHHLLVVFPGGQLQRLRQVGRLRRIGRDGRQAHRTRD